MPAQVTHSDSSSVPLGSPKAIWDFNQAQSIDYAERSTRFEAMKGIGDPRMVSPHVSVLNVVGIIPQLRESPWLHAPPPSSYAIFSPPPNWNSQRRDLFTPSAIAASVGTIQDSEVHATNIAATVVKDHSQERQKSALANFYKIYCDISEMGADVRACMGRFVGA